MKEISIVRQNLMDDVNYRPYCGNTQTNCHKRVIYRPVDGQFICPNCKWISGYDDEFVQRYKAKHNL